MCYTGAGRRNNTLANVFQVRVVPQRNAPGIFRVRVGNLHFCDKLLRVEALDDPQTHRLFASEPLGHLAVVGEALRIQSGLRWQVIAGASLVPTSV